MADLFHARLDGIELEMETVEDEFSKSIARYEYPYADGADLEDLGQKARSVRLRCYFWDDDAGHLTYNGHIRLVNHLASTGQSELIHPKYGVMRGCVEQITVRHDDRLMTAEVDITFVEQMRGEISPVEHQDAESGVEGDFDAGQAEQEDEFALDAAEIMGAEKGFVYQALDAAEGIYEQFAGLTLAAREFIREIDQYVTMFQAVVTELINPVNSLLATVSYSVSLPGRVIGPIALAVERTACLYDSLRTSPGRFVSSLELAFDALEAATEGFSSNTSQTGTAARAMVIKHLRIAAAQRIALEAAYLYKEDETNRRKVRRTEQTKSFDVLGRYIGTAETVQVMNVRELESSLAVVRGMIQAAVDEARSVRSLQSMARRLLEHVYTVKLEREKIIEIELDNPLPLHLVCLRYGLPYNYAERIRSINPSLADPNFTTGRVAIYVR